MYVEVFFAISGHILTVVGTDGASLKPIVTDYIQIGPGQIMDILVTANQSPGRYYVAARQFYTDTLSITEYDKVNVTIILEYNGKYTATPSFPTQLPGYTDMNSAISLRNKMRSLDANDVPNNITTFMFITTAQTNSYSTSQEKLPLLVMLQA